MASTSMPLFDSLLRILYLLGEMEDAMTMEVITVVNTTMVFVNMLFKFYIKERKKESSLARVFLYTNGFLLFGI